MKEREKILFAFLEVGKAKFAIEAMPGIADASYASGGQAIDTSFICMIDGM